MVRHYYTRKDTMTSYTQELYNVVCERGLQIMQNTSLRVWKLNTPVLHTK